MRVLAVADIHGNLRSVTRLVNRVGRDFDAVLLAGDITNYGPVSVAVKVLEALSTISRNVVYVPGNCDPPELLRGVPGWEHANAHLRVLDVGEYKVMGIGGSTITPFKTPIEFTDEELARMAREALLRDPVPPGEKLMLLSHTPPYGTSLDLTYTGKHVGSRTVLKLIERVKPIAAVVGHIHEARGVIHIGGTLIVNPGPLRRGLYAVLELDEHVDAKLLHL